MSAAECKSIQSTIGRCISLNLSQNKVKQNRNIAITTLYYTIATNRTEYNYNMDNYMKARHNRHVAPTYLLVIACLLCLSIRGYAQQWAGSGITEPFRDAIVSSTVSGTISAINVKEGRFVEKGDPIIELDSTLERLEVDRRELIAESKVDLVASKKQLEILQKDYESTKKLFEDTQSISEQEVFRKELEYMVAQAEYDRLILAEQLEGTLAPIVPLDE